MSVVTSTVLVVNSADVVDAGDAALQALLAALAERTRDSERRDEMLDLMLTLPPVRRWSTDSLMQLQAAFDDAGLRPDRSQTSGGSDT